MMRSRMPMVRIPVGKREKIVTTRRSWQLERNSLAIITTISLVCFLFLLDPAIGFSGTRYTTSRTRKHADFHPQNLYRSDLLDSNDDNYPSESNHLMKSFHTRVKPESASALNSEQIISNEDASRRQSTLPKYNLTLLLVDHYDSFTYNLYDMLAQFCVNPPIVLAKDAFEDWTEVLEEYNGTIIDGVILSPGPGTPTHPDDIGTLSPSIIKQNSDLPILGVCLGHQIMGHVYGATVDLCGPVHGQVRTIETTVGDNVQTTTNGSNNLKDDVVGDLLWKEIPSRINVTRYHSLAVRLEPPKKTNGVDINADKINHDIPLRPTAYSLEQEGSEQSVLMGMSHVRNPHFGVQFHPESIGSDYGYQLLQNFCEICQQYQRKHNGMIEKEQSSASPQPSSRAPPQGHDRIKPIEKEQSEVANAKNVAQKQIPSSNIHSNAVNEINGKHSKAFNSAGRGGLHDKKQSKYQILAHKIPAFSTTMTPLEVYETFLQDESFSVWLDTSRGIQSSSSSNDEQVPTYSSILGAGEALIEYFGKEYPSSQQGLYQYDRLGQSRIALSTGSNTSDILSYLQSEHTTGTDFVTMVSFDEDGSFVTKETSEDDNHLPFEFRGGHVGYLGYEVRHDTQRFLQQQEHGSGEERTPSTWESSLFSPSREFSQSNKPEESIPTAAFLFLDKSWVFDHSTEDWYVISVVVNDEKRQDVTQERQRSALEWMQSTSNLMRSKVSSKGSLTPGENETLSDKNRYLETQGYTPSHERNGGQESVSVHEQTMIPPQVTFTPNRPRRCYNQNFADCQEQIRLGESYELCLTNKLEAEVITSSTPLELYKRLRERNPAPFSAFLNWNSNLHNRVQTNDNNTSSFAVCCSSPERFVSVKRKLITSDKNEKLPRSRLEVEAKPIKGTCARVVPKNPKAGLTAEEREEDQERARVLQASIKNRAENLMIVDLLRNDLSRVCETGSVHVSKLMDIESYATVHQMVSTIRGSLGEGQATAVDVLKATFPGGSMTGAPKKRTMEILNRLEQGISRGPYSGCLGYISLNGSMDMNIVIRTAVLTPSTSATNGDVSPSNAQLDNKQTREWRVSIGAGGAITALSENDDEYEEMILKASAIVKSVEDWACHRLAEEGNQ